jgi:lipopolysaccharide/colanic/teichoic acid biosynthesis glycosyltransferase
MTLSQAADRTLASLGLFLISPLLLVLSLLILIKTGRPVFYVATRVGMGGRPFGLYKFRTMTTDAADKGPAITVKGDTRVTTVGRVLRGYKLDELPQLLNVVKGDMALVGPRPEDPKYVSFYTPAQRQILAVRPGMTSLASLRFSSEDDLLEGPGWEARYLREIMPAKLRMEIEYQSRRSLLGDLGVVMLTVLRLLGDRRPAVARGDRQR